MARLARLSLPGVVHHVVHLGHEQVPIFRDEIDAQRFLALLAESSVIHNIAVHAFVLLPGRFHLLVTPFATGQLSKFMQGLSRRYAHAFNNRHRIKGALWEGRFRSGVLQADAYLWSAMAYLDWQPVFDHLVERPVDYPWSSHGHYRGKARISWIRPHESWWALGNTPFAREDAYGELVQGGVDQKRCELIRMSALRGWSLGSEAFLSNLAEKTPRPLQPRRPGRPSQSPASSAQSVPD